MAFRALAGRVAMAGEPFQLLFTPEELDAELARAGFRRYEQLGFSGAQRTLFFAARRRPQAAIAGLGQAGHRVGLITD